MNATDPNVQAVLSQIRAVLVFAGGIMASLGYANTSAYHLIMIASGAVVAGGSAIWGLYTALVTLRKARAVGVQAGINLATSGQAIDSQGNIISKFAPGATPPKQVTLQTSDQIVKDFAPTAPIAKA